MKNNSLPPADDDAGPDASAESEVARVFDGYLADLEAGRAADPARLLAEHPAIAEQLRACLEVMQLADQMADGDSATPGARAANGSSASPRPLGSGLLSSWDTGAGPPPRIQLQDLTDGCEPMIKPRSREMPTFTSAGSARYQLQGEIARGGMGAILKGRDVDLGRELAIKVLLDSHKGDNDVVRRFVEEAQIGGQLQHPGTVPVYELGTFPDRRPYFAMKLVKGRTLASLLHERAGRGSPDPALASTEGLPPRLNDLPRFIGVFEQICQTMAYAHARGVIHRDLKPSNVMVGSFGEVQVMDWGLAKVLLQGGIADEAGAQPVHETVITTVRSGSAGSGSESQAGSVLGTPAYMAPEQARGDVGRIDERADVFGLGAILCEILTGRAPYTGSSRGEIRAQAARGDLADAVSRLDASGAEIELVAVAKACMSVEMELRPRNAGVVAERVTSYLAGVQERLRSTELARVEAQARAEEAQARARIERSRRRRTVALAASVLMTVSVVGGAWAYLARQQAVRLLATTRLVSDALADVERLREKARTAASGDLTVWFEASSAARHARDLLAQGEPDRVLQQRVDAALIGVEEEKAAAARKVGEAERDRKLLADLEAIRGSRSEHWDSIQSDRDYAAAFRKFGIDLDQLDPRAAGQWLAQRSQPIELALYLDDWALQRQKALGKKDEASWRRLLAAAAAADPDPWRVALRGQIGLDDQEALRRLAGDQKTLEVQAPSSLVLLSHVLRGHGDRDRAEAVLQRAWRQSAGDFWVNFELGYVLSLGANQVARHEAVRFYSAAVAIRPRSHAARTNLGVALRNRGKLDEAIAECRTALKLKPDLIAAHANLGSCLEGQGKRDEAIAEWRIALGLNPDSAEAHNNLGVCLKDQGKRDEGIAEMRIALGLNPEYADAHNNLGVALREQGKLDEAIAECRTALRLKPEYAGAHANLGAALAAQEKLDEAIAEYRTALRLNPALVEAHDNLGIALGKQGKLDEATAEHRAAARLKPEYPGAHTNLGVALAAQQKLDEAIAEYRTALRLKPEDSVVHTNLGIALVAQGKLDEAIAEYRTALRLNPDLVGAHTNLGVALVGQGKLDEATAEHRTALRLKPEDSEVHANLGIALVAQGKLDEAIAEYRTALRLNPALVEAHDNLGIALGKQGKLDEAIAEYRTALRLNPEYGDAHSNLGVALSEQGKPDEAIAEYRTALRLNPESAGAHTNLGAPWPPRRSWTRRSSSTVKHSVSSPITTLPTTTSESPSSTKARSTRLSRSTVPHSMSIPMALRPT